jgi:hypothetical protein
LKHKFSELEFGQETREAVKNFYFESIEEKYQFIDYGWKQFNKLCLGMKKGLVIIGGPPNFGKSSFILNLYHQILTHNDNVKVVDFTLDDDRDTRIKNTIAMISRIPINQVGFAFNTIKDPILGKRLKSAYPEFNKRLNNLEILDAGCLNCSSRVLETIIAYSAYQRSKLTENETLVVVIDGFHNLILSNNQFGSDEVSKQNHISSTLKAAATELDIIFLCTAHTKKGSRRRGTSTDDVKGGVGLSYDSTIMGTIFNDVKVNRGNADIYARDDEGNMKQIIEIDISKSKASDLDGTIFYLFEQEKCYVEECPTEEQEHFGSIIYTGHA